MSSSVRSAHSLRTDSGIESRVHLLVAFRPEADDRLNREVDGYRLPFSVDGGNFFGTEDYFPFFRARVRAIRVLPQGGRR